MGAAFDAHSVVTSSSSTSTVTTEGASTITVGASATFLTVLMDIGVGSPGTPSIHWDAAGTNQSMTQIGSTIAQGSNSLACFGLVNPTPGAKKLSWSWSGTAGNSLYYALISHTGTDASSVAGATYGFGSGTAGTGSPATATTTLSIPTGDAAVSLFENAVQGFNGTFVSNAVQADGGKAIGKNQSGSDNAAAEYYSGAGSTIVASAANGPSDAWIAIVFGIKGGAVATSGENKRTVPVFGPGNGPSGGRRVLQAFPDPSTSATLTAAFGSFAESGIAATFDTALVANFGSFALTGFGVQFVGGMPQVGTPADYLFGPGRGPGRGLKPTQAFPDTITSATLAAAFGSFVETGEPVTFDTGLAAAFASFAESGQAVTFDSRMPAAFGTFAETGVAASFDTALTAGFGSFALTGIAAQFVGGMPQVGQSSKLLFAPGGGPTRGLRPTTAFPDTVTASITLTAGTGIYAETGEPVTFDTALAAAFGSFAETGQAITADTALNASPGIFVLTGVAATLVPTGQPTGPSPGGMGIVSHAFTRKRWRELQDLIAAEEAAEAKARGADRPHLAHTAAQVREAIEALEQVEAREAVAADVRKLTRTVQGALGAKSLRASIAQATAANAIAKAMTARIAEMERDEDEEITMLLLS